MSLLKDSYAEDWEGLKSSADELTQWKFERQQNIIDEVDAYLSKNPMPEGKDDQPTAEQRTAMSRKKEALGEQRYLIGTVVSSDDINKALDKSDEDWVKANPKPKPPADPEEE